MSWGDSGHIPTVVQGKMILRYLEIRLWLTVAVGAGDGCMCVRKSSQTPPCLILSLGDKTGDYLLSKSLANDYSVPQRDRLNLETNKEQDNKQNFTCFSCSIKLVTNYMSLNIGIKTYWKTEGGNT